MKSTSPITMAFPGPPRGATGMVRYMIVAILILLMLGYLRQHHVQTAVGDSSIYMPSADTRAPPLLGSNQKVGGSELPVKGLPEPLPLPDTAPAPIEQPNGNPSESDSTKAAHQPETNLPEQKPAQAPVEQPKPNAPEPEREHAPFDHPGANPPPSAAKHPIDDLIKGAETHFADLLKRESKDLKSAAAEYRKQRGRHPPPGFDTWFRFAQDNGAVMVEEFWDQIYHDLAPFWGLPPKTMRREAWDYEMTIHVRDQKAAAGADWFWTQIWLNLTQTIEHMLPDVSLALNAMDEPRIATPWEKINEYMEIERSTRAMAPPKEVISEYQRLENPGDGPDREVKTRPKGWEETYPFWKVVSRGCHPESLARKAAIMTDFSHIPDISLQHTLPYTYKGYVQNFSLSTDFCNQPDLQSLHGMMIHPLSVSSTKTMFPMFGGSKLPTNNEILLPAPMYWSGEERFSGGNEHGKPWADKLDEVIWRGVATGGRNMPGNWKGFQRHRFIAMTNATQITQAENWEAIPQNWAMPSRLYNLAAQEEHRLGEWTDTWANTGFVDRMCHERNCSYVAPYFNVTPGVKMREQFQRKYLPDIDGNSFSGRYRGFLLSNSLPIKATIFKEWHDSRLMPWVHFVPMDNRFQDFYGIMEYFVGYEGKNIKIEGHDAAAEKIALAGQAWANKVLRREDMQIYVHRLLLEYARIGDDNRDKMGYVKDLL